MANSGGFQRVVQLFWDKELENTDHDNPIVVLGNAYDPREKSYSDDEDLASAEVITSTGGTPINLISDFKQYFQSFSNNTSSESVKKAKDPSKWPADFIKDVHTRIWLTYRTKFAPILRDEDGPSPVSLQNLLRGQNYELNKESFTTDCGWGCMIRTGQTLLANALLDLHLGRQWRFTEESNEKHDQIVSWFIDCPSHPFSIHGIVDKGRSLSGKKVGEWFGPSAAARSIQALCEEFDAGIRVHIGSDSGDIYENDVFKIAKDEDGIFKPILILLGVRLGIENINKLYWSSLKSILESEESVGISGGRPSSSHYFFGFQGDYLFYLDPHVPQPALLHEDGLENSVSDSTDIVSSLDIQSVHTKKLRKIHISEVDPSMLLGFLIRSEDEWTNWKKKIQSADNKNSVVHISPDHILRDFSNRKPSFVVYDENGDDFVDVGLEYEDLPEEEDFEQVNQNQTSDEVSESEEETKESKESVILLSEAQEEGGEIEEQEIGNDEEEVASGSGTIIPELSRPEPSTGDGLGSFENYSTSINDDYENIGTSVSEGVKIPDESLHIMNSSSGDGDEEPYIVKSSEILPASPSGSDTLVQAQWESSN